ncbi:hypothetical protein BHM03_00045412 [Ensete ventricosum]|nr:hypothetical protein BHM03_00045412 [Ensete ventricosum]
MQCSLISSYFHFFTEEQTIMLKVFPNDDLGTTAHDRKKEQEKGIHMTLTAMMSSISMLALPERGNVFVLGVDTSRVGINAPVTDSITIRHDLPPRHHGSRYHLYAFTAIALPRGDGPCDRCHCPYWRQPWPWAVAPCGLAVGVARFRLAASSVPLAGWPLAVAPCRRRAICGRACKRLPPPMQGCLGCSRSPLCRGPWPQSATPLQVVRPWPATLVGGLVVANHPYIWPNCGRLPPFLDVFAAKIQKERVERLYAIQSHYT